MVTGSVECDIYESKTQREEFSFQNRSKKTEGEMSGILSISNCRSDFLSIQGRLRMHLKVHSKSVLKEMHFKLVSSLLHCKLSERAVCI